MSGKNERTGSEEEARDEDGFLEVRRRKNDEHSPVQKIDDRGVASSEPVSTTDEGPDSALGGNTATRSGTEPAPNPAEERSE